MSHSVGPFYCCSSEPFPLILIISSNVTVINYLWMPAPVAGMPSACTPFDCDLQTGAVKLIN